MAYNATVNYYRINQNNQAIASSPSGASTAPTEEIVAPLSSGGTYSSRSGATITGTATNFSLFAQGEYLYYLSGAGAFVLMGQIDTITDATTLVLTTNPPLNIPPGTEALYAAKNLIAISEPFFIRVSTQKTGLPNGQAIIPDLTAWRASNAIDANNNTAVTKLERVSNVGTPISNTTAENVPFTIAVQNVFTQAGNSTFFPTVASVPDYIWLRAVPKQTLSGTTAYRISTEENIADFLLSPLPVAASALQAKGYLNITGGGISGNTGTGGGA